MNIKPHNLKSFFNWIRKSPVDDIAFNAVKSNADDVARGALDVVDDIPSSISFDDIADTYNYQKNMPQPKSYDDLISNLKTDLSNRHDSRVMNSMFPGYGEIVSGADAPRFTDFTNDDVPQLPLDSTPDYDAMAIDLLSYGQKPDLIDSVMYPDGFGTPEAFARYYDDLELGFQTSPHAILNGRDIQYTAASSDGLIIDGKRYHYPDSVADANSANMDYDEMLRVLPEQDMLKANIMDSLGDRAHQNYFGIKDIPPYRNGIPMENVVFSNNFTWRPHNNEALAKFYKKNGRLPKGLNGDYFDEFWFNNIQPF